MVFLNEDSFVNGFALNKKDAKKQAATEALYKMNVWERPVEALRHCHFFCN